MARHSAILASCFRTLVGSSPANTTSVESARQGVAAEYSMAGRYIKPSSLAGRMQYDIRFGLLGELIRED